MENPLISIVIPTYNRAHKLSTPINSIVRQTLKNWEIIIVDDCSTDQTQQMVAHLSTKYPIKCLTLPKNYGPSVARNTGMSHARGKYSAFLDSDDEWSPQFLEKMSAVLDRNHNYGLVYCDSQIYDLNKKPYYVFTFEPYSYIELLNSQGKIPTGAFMFRTDCWHQLDGFNKDIIRGEDFDWLLRFGEFFDFARCPSILHHYYRDRDGLIHTTSRDKDLLKVAAHKLHQTKQSIKKRKFG